jgi:DNA polymerase-3 subunit chi
VTRIDFYILQDVHLTAQRRFACRLASRALGGKSPERVVLHLADEPAARELDELLWHYPDKRFVPHSLQGTSGEKDAQVLVSWQEPPHFDGVLVNLSTQVPDFFTRFQRVMEVVVGETRDQGRERYRFYRHRGYPLYDHKMEDWETAAP